MWTYGSIKVHARNGRFKPLCCFKTREEALEFRNLAISMTEDQFSLAYMEGCQCDACNSCNQNGGGGGGVAPLPLPPPTPTDQANCAKSLLTWACSDTGKSAMAGALVALDYASANPAVTANPALGGVVTAAKLAITAAQNACSKPEATTAAITAVCVAATAVKNAGPAVGTLLTLLTPVLGLLGTAEVNLIRKCCNV